MNSFYVFPLVLPVNLIFTYFDASKCNQKSDLDFLRNFLTFSIEIMSRLQFCTSISSSQKHAVKRILSEKSYARILLYYFFSQLHRFS